MTPRKRNPLVEQSTSPEIDCIAVTVLQFEKLSEEILQLSIQLADDLGDRIFFGTTNTFLLIWQAYSHTQHYFSNIGYLLFYLGIILPDEDFGSNTASPKQTKVRSCKDYFLLKKEFRIVRIPIKRQVIPAIPSTVAVMRNQ